VELAYCFVYRKSVDTDLALKYNKLHPDKNIFKNTQLYIQLRLRTRMKAEKMLCSRENPFR